MSPTSFIFQNQISHYTENATESWHVQFQFAELNDPSFGEPIIVKDSSTSQTNWLYRLDGYAEDGSVHPLPSSGILTKEEDGTGAYSVVATAFYVFSADDLNIITAGQPYWCRVRQSNDQGETWCNWTANLLSIGQSGGQSPTSSTAAEIASAVWSSAERSLTESIIAQLSSVPVSIRNLLSRGNLILNRGDSLLKSEGTEITIKETEGSGWPLDLSDYTLTLELVRNPASETPGADQLTINTVSISPSAGSSRIITIQISVSESESLATDVQGYPAYSYKLMARNGSTKVSTLVRGSLSVI